MTSIEAQVVIMRRYAPESGLTEARHAVESLEELFQFITENDQPPLVDRVELKGETDAGHTHTIVFSFQSMSLNMKRGGST